MWGFEVCLVNAYVAYVKICTNIYNIEKNVSSHHYFQRWVDLGWINPEKYGPKSCNFMEASRKKQSRVSCLSYVGTERTTPAKVSVKSIAMRAIRNRVNDAALDLLKVKLRNRVVFGGQDKLRHTPHQIIYEELCTLHRWKYGR